MTRMSREFSLVLLSSSLLAAGYFLLPEEDPAKAAEQSAAAGGAVGGRHFVPLVFITRAGSPSPVSGAVRGGFGRTGSSFGGGMT